jgi:hypothetical protein
LQAISNWLICEIIRSDFFRRELIVNLPSCLRPVGALFLAVSLTSACSRPANDGAATEEPSAQVAVVSPRPDIYAEVPLVSDISA